MKRKSQPDKFNSQRKTHVDYRRVKLSDIHEDPENARLHPDENLADIRASLKEFGQVEPLVVQKNSGKVIGGNGRLKVMRELGWTECDVAYVDFNNKKSTALGIALNRSGERAEWDTDVLEKLLEDIGDVGAELEQSLKELEVDIGIADEPGEVDAEPQIDKAAELQKKWGTETGQLWLIGEHRLLCGDSTKREDVERVMGGEMADACVSDPPYNVGIEYGKETNDTQMSESYWQWQHIWFNLAKEISGRQVITPGCVNLDKWLYNFIPCHVAIWDKGEGANTYGRVTKYWAWEPIMCHGKFNRKRHTDVFRITALGENPGHPCPKPVMLWKEIIDSFSEGNLYEPFSGSGTTFVAAQNLNRKCYGIEISPAYCAVILERMKTAFPKLVIKK